jgi:TatD DNase family protein
MYIDTHLHLDEPWLYNDDYRKQAIEDITKNRIVTLAQSVGIESYKITLEYCKESEYIFPSFGILPWYAHEYIDRVDEIAELCKDAIMLGEIGLDEVEAKDKVCIPHQRPLFEIFLESAEKNNQIMNLHFRGGLGEEGFEYLQSYKIKRAIFHGGVLDLSIINKISDAGYYFTTGPSVINLNPKWAEYHRNYLKKVPDDLLLLEIDSLDMDNFELPSQVFPKLQKAVAEIKNTTPEEVEAANHKNMIRLVGNDPKLMDMMKLLKKK